MTFTIEDITKAARQLNFGDDLVLKLIAYLPKKRSSQQNKSLHLFCKMIADKLNDEGQTWNMAGWFGRTYEVPFSLKIVKENIWKPIQLALFDKESTTALNTEEINKVVDVINKHISERFGISAEWPSLENINE